MRYSEPSGAARNTQAAAKALIRAVAGQAISDELIEDTAHRIAALRATAEAREGLAAFLEKRRPAWIDAIAEVSPNRAEN